MIAPREVDDYLLPEHVSNKEVSLVPRPHPLTRRIGLVNQISWRFCNGVT